MGRQRSRSGCGAALFIGIIPTVLDQSNTLLSFPGFFKATPVEEAGDRFIYMEASNEARDMQGEIVLAKALEASASYYARYGNVDLDHKTQIGAQMGLADPYQYEIGRPVDVKVRGGRTFVKAAIYSGDTPVAAHANAYWDSVTKLNPPKRWYPSVGGAVMERGQALDKSTQTLGPAIKSVRWTNIGLSQTPVNITVPQVGTVPMGALTKSLGFDLVKAMVAGYGSDSATLDGGGALRGQSLDRKVQSYWDFRDRAAGDVRKKRTTGKAADLVDHAHHEYGLSKAQAAEWAERFHADLRAGLSQKGTHP